MDLLPRKSVRSARTLAFKGEDLLKIAPRRMEDLRGSHMSMIFQEPMTSLNRALTIGTQLMETVLRHNRVSKPAARERAIYLLDQGGIHSAATRCRQYPHHLSGGLREPVRIALALRGVPQLMTNGDAAGRDSWVHKVV